MKKTVIWIMLITLFTTPILVQADQSVLELFKQQFPGMKDPVIEQSPIPSLYEVIVGGNILYFEPTTKYLLMGEILDQSGQSLTRPRIATAKQLILEANRESAVKIGNGPTVVYEVSDPDCPFCRKMHSYWEGRTDVTRYVFLTALPMHPQAPAKINYIFNSTDKAIAMDEVYSGKHDNRPPESKDSPLAIKNHELAKHLSGGTPQYWINGHHINGADINKISSILNSKGEEQ